MPGVMSTPYHTRTPSPLKSPNLPKKRSTSARTPEPESKKEGKKVDMVPIRQGIDAILGSLDDPEPAVRSLSSKLTLMMINDRHRRIRRENDRNTKKTRMYVVSYDCVRRTTAVRIR